MSEGSCTVLVSAVQGGRPPMVSHSFDTSGGVDFTLVYLPPSSIACTLVRLRTRQPYWRTGMYHPTRRRLRHVPCTRGTKTRCRDIRVRPEIVDQRSSTARTECMAMGIGRLNETLLILGMYVYVQSLIRRPSDPSRRPMRLAARWAIGRPAGQLTVDQRSVRPCFTVRGLTVASPTRLA